ncbi:tumor necrosis factor receptor superfamily member 8 isoform X2 [Hemicordylus capensis]|uniref:tumor necrosis factor receptor superfamily member 8 isoform X2 n=1 Tax=Hemicordylus capensis TaxID=884348 RepID=UPI002302285D|nr:tumor necrosis factor receptor superfamily member 8 isoform X2 [Hemicordylus capensis]
MRGQNPALGLLLFLGCLQRSFAPPPQGPALSPQSCDPREKWYYDQKSQKCCFRCQMGYIPKKECPTDPVEDCIKRCQPNQFLNQQFAKPRCQICMTCTPEHNLVQESPCSEYSNAKCACQPGMSCTQPIHNSCAECSPVTSQITCEPGFRVKPTGTPECEQCPPGSFSAQVSSSKECKSHTNCAKMNKVTTHRGNSTHDTRCADVSLNPATEPARALTPKGGGASTLGVTATRHPFSTSHVAGPQPAERPPKNDDDHATIAGVVLFSVLVLLAALLVLRRRRVCRKWIIPHKIKIQNQAKICARIRAPSLAGQASGEGELKDLETLQDAPKNASLLEMDVASELIPESAELVQADGGASAEPDLRSHTSNHIEKIYIMRAGTVIVGSVSEVPAGKTCSAKDEDGSAGGQEEPGRKEMVVHYPEQETEFYPRSDITTPVEEEWEFNHSTEKPLTI